MAKKRMSSDYAPESRLPVTVAMLAVGLLQFALPEHLSIGPRWLLLAVVTGLLVPIIFSHHRGNIAVNRILTLAANGVVTLALIVSLGRLVAGLPGHKEDPQVLLRSAAALWITNVLVFALWYWRLDAGGPHERDRLKGEHVSSFLFPQMLVHEDADSAIEKNLAGWTPNFIDYLFLAFNTSTAFSPTDTAVLSRWAKGVAMVQSLISLSVVALLASRAVNIL